jgi:hypothetical protein
MKDKLWDAWEFVLDGVDYCASWVSAYPKTALAALIVLAIF